MESRRSARPGAHGIDVPQVLRYNHLAFIELGKDMTPPEGGFHGYFKAASRGIYLYRLDRTVEAFLVRDERRHEFFVITAFQRVEGIWHMYSTTAGTEKWLGIEEMGYMATIESVKAAHFEPLFGTEVVAP